MAKKYHGKKGGVIGNALSSSRPGHGVDYSSPFPKNGFINHVIMKDYPNAGAASLDNPYHSLEDIDRMTKKDRSGFGKGKTGPF